MVSYVSNIATAGTVTINIVSKNPSQVAEIRDTLKGVYDLPTLAQGAQTITV